MFFVYRDIDIYKKDNCCKRKYNIVKAMCYRIMGTIRHIISAFDVDMMETTVIGGFVVLCVVFFWIFLSVMI